VESTADVMGGSWIGVVDASVETGIVMDLMASEGIVVGAVKFSDAESMTMVEEVESATGMLDVLPVIVASIESERVSVVLEGRAETTVGVLVKAGVVDDV